MAIVARSVTKRFGDFVALDDASVAVIALSTVLLMTLFKPRSKEA